MPQVHHMWTKAEIKQVFALWESSNPQDLADRLNVDVKKLKNLVMTMRKAGFPLVKKRQNGIVKKMLDEVKAELGIA